MTTAASPPVAPPGFREPTFGQRLGGAFIDGLVLLPAGLVLGGLVSERAGALTMFIVASAYFITLTARSGQTLGKRLAGTRVVDFGTGEIPSWGRASVRWAVLGGDTLLVAIVPALSGIVPVYALILVGGALRAPLHRSLHDHAAATVVTRLPT